MPDRMYPNSIEALDASYARGLRIFEIDFRQLPFGLMRTGHDPIDVLDPRSAWVSQVFDWFRHHPDARLITDIKTDNVRGLRLMATQAGNVRRQIHPFIYKASEYGPSQKLGFAAPIARFDSFDSGWWAFANSHALGAVALRDGLEADMQDVHHPVLLFTLNRAPQASGLRGVITDCLVPAEG